MDIIKIIMLIIEIILAIFSIFLIGVVLLQSGKRSGLSGSIAGGAETFFGKKKARGYEHRMNLLTTITAIGFMVLAVILLILQTRV